MGKGQGMGREGELDGKEAGNGKRKGREWDWKGAVGNWMGKRQGM